MRISDIYEGQKVRVCHFSEENIPDHWNEDGEMNKWMGRTVTIAHFSKQDGEIYIEEDGNHWMWYASDFVPVALTAAQMLNPNFLFKARKGF